VLAKDGKMNIQVGANDGETITIDLKKIDSKTLGLDSFNVNGPAGTPTAAGATEFKAAYGSTTNVTGATVAESTANELSTRLGVAASGVAVDSGTVYKDDNGKMFAKVTVTSASDAETNNLKANGFDIASGAANAKTFYVAVDPQSADTSTTTGTAAFKLDTTNMSLSSLTSGASANPLAKLDDAIASVDKFRSSLGAIQNRLNSAVTNLSNTTTNLSAAQSRIQDADYATEVSNMSKAQIVQRAGNSVLAKANQVPQQVLSLLQG